MLRSPCNSASLIHGHLNYRCIRLVELLLKQFVFCCFHHIHNPHLLNDEKWYKARILTLFIILYVNFVYGIGTHKRCLNANNGRVCGSTSIGVNLLLFARVITTHRNRTLRLRLLGSLDLHFSLRLRRWFLRDRRGIIYKINLLMCFSQFFNTVFRYNQWT